MPAEYATRRRTPVTAFLAVRKVNAHLCGGHGVHRTKKGRAAFKHRAAALSSIKSASAHLAAVLAHLFDILDQELAQVLRRAGDDAIADQEVGRALDAEL